MSNAKIYVGNLPYTTTESDLRDHFAQYGTIEEVKLIVDFQTGRSKGFSFITFSSDQEGEAAIQSDGADFDGRKLKVNTAKSDDRRRSGGGGGGGGGGGYGGGGHGGGGHGGGGGRY